MKRPASAVWVVRKPVGVTSASLVDDFRRAHPGNFSLKVSHGGVLDPFAEGVVLLLVGAANRLFDAMHEAPKRYVARVQWGHETDSGDALGLISGASAPAPANASLLEQALGRFAGWTDQVPPVTSNKRVDGERAYVRAHRGESFAMAPQRVFLQHAAWLRHQLPEWSELELVVRGGFYVRSLAVDLGRSVGSRAHLSTLERTHIGPWAVTDQSRMITGVDVLPWLPSVRITDAEQGQLKRGEPVTFPAARVEPASWPLPSGFPAPTAGVRAVHQGRVVALISDGEAPLLLPGGV